jgi:hypothetical protein
LGRLIENKKIERGMGRLHCGGRHLKGGHNNQIKVGFDVGGGVGDERQPGRKVWGVVVSRNRASNRRRIKTKIKLVVALDGSRRVQKMQQPTKNTRALRGRDKIRGATPSGNEGGAVHSIVLGRTSWEGG